MQMHSGAPRHWSCLIQRIDVWSGFMTMWIGIADDAQAKRMVFENIFNEKSFYAKFRIRTLSKLEKNVLHKKSGNSSCWLDRACGISNYMFYKSLLNYGYDEYARKIVKKTVEIFGRSIEECGHMYEHYDPDIGEVVNNFSFQIWNFLVNNMLAWYEGRETVSEF